jgi:hypothetical protein
MDDDTLAETHPIAVLARVGLLVAVAILITASLLTPPRLFYSYHAQHFVAFYVLSLTAALAIKRKTIIGLGVRIAIFAFCFEMIRSFSPLHARTTYLDWIADAAGIVGALAPMLGQKIRQRFKA